MDGSGVAKAGGFASTTPDGLVIGTVVAVEAAGALVSVLHEDGPQRIRARSMVLLRPEDVGSAVVVMFAAGDGVSPMILGRLQGPTAVHEIPSPFGPSMESPKPEVIVDGERVELSAEREITLRCGKASLTLTRTGKIVLRGTYILSRSSGPNKIKGGSIQLN